ncbi:MAG TPA: peroxidase family protein [Mycobacterium sp.]|nr:peroxidase family protein [Mycobacterium sp.]
MTIKITRLDLDYILSQIELSEAGQPPVNPLLAFGLREVAGTNNNGVPGQSTFGASGQVFPTITDPIFQNAQFGTSYSQTSGMVYDAQPRLISQLIASQTTANPAAIAAQLEQLGQLGDGYLNLTTPGADGLFGGTYVVTSAGADAAYGTDDDTAISYGADGKPGGGDDIVGTRASLSLHTFSNGADGIINTADDVLSDDILAGNLATPTDRSSSGSTIPGLAQSLFIPNITPDNGLSAPANSFFTFFGQFFDHGLDMISKGGNDIVYIPLSKDDPLYVVGGHSNFMVLTRATDQPGPDGIVGTADDVHSHINQTSPFVDQSQTYASDPSHQVFLREYMVGVDGKLHSTGALLGGAVKPGLDGKLGTADDRYSMATWGDLKANAAQFLGIRITDLDVGNVPLLATDPYGNLILNPLTGRVQIVTQTGLVDAGPMGSPAQAIALPANTVRTGNAFINDMAHNASPVDDFGNPIVADGDILVGNPEPFNPLTGANLAYDDELLNAHYVAGDGRVNENVGLTAIQDLFHSEHDRLLAQIKTTIQAGLSAGDVSFATDWVLPGVNLTTQTATNGVPDVAVAGDGTITAIHIIQPNEWNGERLFQAAKFGTETEYQHIVFDEFARYVAPSIHVAGATNVHIDPAITSEFANVVYRFGHSMLDENINIYQLGADGKPVIGANGQPVMTQEGLIQAFTNPTLFAQNVGGDTAANATADIVLGTVNQVSASIDEFVTGSLQNNLLGLPLDLGALNIARGRDTGVAPLNLVRNQLFSKTGDAQLRPYTSWADFGGQIKHPESLVNFIAAYGTEPSIGTIKDATTGLDRPTTMLERRAAAQRLVDNGTLGSATFNLDAYNFLNSKGSYASPPIGVLRTADARTIHDSTGAEATWSTGSVTGLDNVDLWIGGLAEKISLFGGVLGSTFEYVFRTQLEALQDADRLYYLPRIEGTDYEESLQDSSLAQLIRANTDIKHLPGNIFLTPEYTVEASTYFNADGSVKNLNPDGSFNTTNWLHNPVTGKLLVNINPDGTLQFIGDDNFLGNTIVLGGTEGNDKLTAGAADDDTVWGDGGNDIIDGGFGNDFLFGGAGNDTLFGGEGDDTIHGDTGNDTIYGGDGIDTIFGGDGNDYIDGGRGDDVILGGLGNDIIIGNEGTDELTGGEGDDWIESRGGSGQLMFGDSGAPTGGQALYSANDVMIGGVAGGAIMKGFSGDDIMVGGGSFTKFLGMLGFDWGSYEIAVHGVDADMNRKEFIAPNGSEDAIRDIWQHTEGVSGSAFDDLLKGTNDTRLLATKDELDNVNLIGGLQSFFPTGIVSFDGGNIMLGGAGNDTIIGGGGTDIIDGDAWLHVGLVAPPGSPAGTSGYSAGASILRQIMYDPNGNTYVPAHLDLASGLFVPASGVAHAGNVDTAVYNDVFSDFDIGLFGPDAQGFIHVDHARAGAAIVGGNPQGLLGGDDGNDKVRHIERLQFTDITVSIDSLGNVLTSSDGLFHSDRPTDIFFSEHNNYDAVAVGKPTITESGGLDPAVTVNVGQTLTASMAGVTDADGIVGQVSYQWQENDLLRGEWVPIAGATTSTYLVPKFFDGALGFRMKASFMDGKGYTETVYSDSTAVITLPGGGNTAPRFAFATQFNGISDTSALVGKTFDYFSPFSDAAGVGIIFVDEQTASNALHYSATLGDGSSLALAGLGFNFNPVTGAGEFFTLPADPLGPDGVAGTGDEISGTLDTPGQIAVRVTVTDTGPGVPLSLVDNFFINVLPANSGPIALDDSYTVLKSVAFTTLPSQSVLRNDTDPNGDPFTAKLVTGPAHGTLAFSPDGTFVYTSNNTFTGVDTFTYQDTDNGLATSNVATATINVLAFDVPPVPSQLAEVATGSEDTTISGTLLPGSDVDGPVPLIFKIVAGSATNGTVTLVAADGVTSVTSNTTGAYVFTPTPNYGTNTVGSPIVDPIFGGPGTFQYLLNDGIKDSLVSKTVSVNITPVDDGKAPLTLSGNAAAGSTLTATLGVDPEGIGIPPVFTWQRDTTAIAGVTGSTYTLTEADVGHKISALAKYTDGQNFATVLNATTVTVGEVFVKPTVLANRTDVTASNNLFTSAGLAVTGATYKWETSANGITWTTAAPGVTFGPVLTGVTGEFVRATASYVDNGVTVNVPSLATHYINDTAVGTPGHSLTGVTGTDIIFAGPGDDVITPGAGNDYVSTRTGNNTIVATVGDGNDIYIGGVGTDTYDMSGTSAAATVNLSGATPVASSADTGLDTLNSIENVTGGSGNDTITGNPGANILIGGAGDDSLIGGAGNDTLNGDAGNDTLDGGAGNDTMTGGTGDDTYVVDSTSDVVTENLSGGTDTIKTTLASYSLLTTNGANVENLTYTGAVNFTGTGNALANQITGGAGNDTLDGGTGADTMIGKAGNDTYFVDNAGDKITDTSGIDTVDTTLATYALDTTNTLENLTFVGGNVSFNGAGNGLANILTGGSANDILNGGNGNDTLIGGAGADTLTGGGGNDLFNEFKGDANGDLITDFTRGSDLMNFFNYGAGATLVKGAVGGGTTTYSVQVGGVTQDTFKLNGNVTLAATDFRFN